MNPRHVASTLVALFLFIASADISRASDLVAPADLAKAFFARLENSLARMPDPVSRQAFYERLDDRLRARLADASASPGLRSALSAVAADLPAAATRPAAWSGVDDFDKINAALASGALSLSARAIEDAPVLYTPDFPSVFGGADGMTAHLDEYEQIDELEFVAFSGSVFAVRAVLPGPHGALVYRVETAEYPYATERGYYVDSRFVSAWFTPLARLPERVAALPSREDVIAGLTAAVGKPYVWGGNTLSGVPDLLRFYPSSGELSPAMRAKWTLDGVDCSGLLYRATNGFTPRNTASLVSYGTGVAIAGKSASGIIAQLRPLDLIAWKGHAIIVIDGGRTIESRLDYDDATPGFQGGVRIRELSDVIDEILAKRVPVDSYDAVLPDGKKPFVVRRWYEAGTND